jgi:hypothetical protein
MKSSKVLGGSCGGIGKGKRGLERLVESGILIKGNWDFEI